MLYLKTETQSNICFFPREIADQVRDERVKPARRVLLEYLCFSLIIFLSLSSMTYIVLLIIGIVLFIIIVRWVNDNEKRRKAILEKYNPYPKEKPSSKASRNPRGDDDDDIYQTLLMSGALDAGNNNKTNASADDIERFWVKMWEEERTLEGYDGSFDSWYDGWYHNTLEDDFEDDVIDYAFDHDEFDHDGFDHDGFDHDAP